MAVLPPRAVNFYFPRTNLQLTLFLVVGLCNVLHLLFPRSLLWVPGDSSAGHQARRKNPERPGGSKRYRTSEDAGATSSAQPMQRTKQVVSKPKEKVKSVSEMNAKDFCVFRRRNPYRHEQDPALVNRPFWTKQQRSIYLDVLKGKKNLFVSVRSIDIPHMQKDMQYFGEALELCNQLDIIKVMEFNKDFDADIVAQFYATVHLGTDVERTLTWMTNGKLLSVKWKAFMELLGYDDKGLDNLVGFRPHKEAGATHKSALWPYSTLKISPTTQKKTYELSPFLDILHRIFRHTLFPRIGNLDQVHSYLVDLLLFCQSEKEANTGQSLDVSHIMWSELLSAITERKCPIYGPYLMLLIEKAWAFTYPDEMFVTGDLISHEIVRLRQKENWGTPVPETETPMDEDVVDDDDEPDYEPARVEPSWAKKLKLKMKKLFCMEAHGQYMAHVAEKKSRGRDKLIMRQLGVEVASGSEERITDEEEWTTQHCHWTDSDVDQTIAAAAADGDSSEHEEY